MAAPQQRADIRRAVAGYAPQALWVEVTHQPQTLRNAEAVAAPLEALHGQNVAAFCGIGNPEGFRHTLVSMGYNIVAWREFPDHHAYARTDIEGLSEWAQGLDAAAVVCTQKDLVKIGLSYLGGRPLWAVAVGLKFVTGEDELAVKLNRLLPEIS
jgi:tetraacyldisaccharide 4'-kinase